MKVLNTVDLFCGLGGATTGLETALSRLGLKHKGIAINHCRVAVATMRANHPDVDAFEMKIEDAIPEELVPSREVDLVWASPSCTHHSRAKGGRPRSNQLRTQPDLILPWLRELFVRRLIVENVPEFMEWGPLTKDGRIIERLKGQCFRKWVESIEACNYRVEWRILNCADYGDATTRRRFFLQAVRKGCGRIVWPEPTHAEHPQPDLWGHTPLPWRGIRECLDLADTGQSIFNRKKPLAANTLRRVFAGLRKYCGLDFQLDFLGADGPDDARLRPLDAPIVTQLAGGNRTAIVRPFIVQLRRHQDAASIDAPVSAIAVDMSHPGDANDERRVTGGSEPMKTMTTRNNSAVAFVMNNNTNNAPRPLDKPIHAITTGNHKFLVQPIVLGQQGGAEARPASKPCPTIATAGGIRVVTPLIVDMSRPGGNDSGHVRSADKPIRAITTCDSVQGIFPVLADGTVIDIRMRMLKPSELAAAHSFPADYKITGNRTEQVKQIGNSVPVMTAAAICEAALSA